MGDSHHRPFTSPAPGVSLIQAAEPGIMLPCSVSTLNHHTPHPLIPRSSHTSDPDLLAELADAGRQPSPGGKPLITAEAVYVPDLSEEEHGARGGLGLLPLMLQRVFTSASKGAQSTFSKSAPTPSRYNQLSVKRMQKLKYLRYTLARLFRSIMNY